MTTDDTCLFDRQLIGGSLVTAGGDATLSLRSPHTEAVDRVVRFASVADVAAATVSARAAFVTWSASSVTQRIEVLRALATALAAASEELAAAIEAEVGTPPRIARAVQVDLPVRVLGSYADCLSAPPDPETVGNSTIAYRPVGVVAAISPWNYPLHQAIAKVGAALAAGCTMVLKPSELVPQTNLLLMQALRDAVPPGVVNVVSGGAEVGRQLCADPQVDAVSFTGSEAVGRAVAVAAAGRLIPSFLELGGKSPGIVLPGADLPRAIKNIVQRGLLNSGQTCNATTRILVPRQRLEEAAREAGAVAAGMKERLGPLISERQFDRVQAAIAQAVADGAELVEGGPGRLDGHDVGYFAKPTVFISNDPGIALCQEEIFGPVLVLQPYDSLTELIELANATRYGLAAVVWGEDDDMLAQVVDGLQVGQIDLNASAFNPAAPFGGRAASGHARELGWHGIRELQYPVAIQR